MLDAVKKVSRVLKQEGVTGAVNRVKYRRDNLLMTERAHMPLQSFTVSGKGRLKARFLAELARHGLLGAATATTTGRKLVFNPDREDFNGRDGVTVVLEDDYLDAIPNLGDDALARLFPGCPLIVTSGAGLKKAVAAGAELRNVTLVPTDESANETRLAIGRWLVYAGALPPDIYFADLMAFGAPIRNRNCVCISLPEYHSRRETFQDDVDPKFKFFNGLRMLPAWKGCAWSYKVIAAKALQSGARRLTICEDDASFGRDFPRYYAAINRYLDRTRWDVFNGVMTRVSGRADIMLQKPMGDASIIHTSHMMGMVFNVYNRTALEWMADWNPDEGGAETNTIDEWLNAMPGLRVVSAVPFVAGHREDVHSTIFGFKNIRYSGMISATEQKILSQLKPV
ncbi:glycosyltransferase family 25 protein [Paracoccus onubensis]|uniref:Glycosyltransferase family 25 protein n=1 Tax=Paracoccus onubensis TaxID=1675788 RepID=A0A418ST41_9RHOB|nr:hypothetical protein [Paracoccus onubensis]RJE84124.1 hypothetical protein D3P04_14040 [Paracoccus onubensis]